MPVISRVGRSSRGVRLLTAVMYFVLVLGSITMIYPFLIMVGGSLRSDVDKEATAIVPRYLYDDKELFQKYVEAKYNETIEQVITAYRRHYFSFKEVGPPAVFSPSLRKDWEEFVKQGGLPARFSETGFFYARGGKVQPLLYRKLLGEAKAETGSLKEFNERFNTDIDSWLKFQVPPPRGGSRLETGTGVKSNQARLRYLEDFKNRQPYDFRTYVDITGVFLQMMIYPVYRPNGIEAYNQAHVEKLTDFNEFSLPKRMPLQDPKLKQEWSDFVKSLVSIDFIKVDAAALPIYQDFLKARYGSVARLNELYQSKYTDWKDISLPGQEALTGLVRTDWNVFIDQKAPAEMLELDGPEYRFRDFLRAKYQTIEKFNDTHEQKAPRFEAVFPPYADVDWTTMVQSSGAVRWEFMTRNYITVYNYLLGMGRGFFNTSVLCVLSILFALTINPIAAFALSRFRLPSTYKILFFLMATMAFPPEVVMIPSFLLIRDLNLLNTFWAIILPTAANGFNIFLLKGFFDSLPQELYESSEIDGASQWQNFWLITMPLSKPILAVIALGAFNAAYASFLQALLVAGDEGMWTLMVYLYQMQQNLSRPAVFASLVLAAIPTLLVFVFCQNIILRGIVVPTEK